MNRAIPIPPAGTGAHDVIVVGVDHLLAPRRHVLDTILLTAAVDAGARFESGVHVTGTITDGRGRVVGITARDTGGASREIRGRIVVGADGVRSRVARSVRARILDERRSDTAAYYAYIAGAFAGAR